MAELEAELFASGLPVEALMEKAALAVSRRLLALRERGGAVRIPAEGVVVLVGPGHNGSDGLVVAREIHLAGIPVRLWSPYQRRKSLTNQHWRHARWLGIPVLVDPPPAEGSELWIDALFGNGQTRAPGPEIEALLEARNCASRGLVAIDVPTGLCGDSGALLGRTAARADLTLCIGLWKRGLLQDLALRWVGQLERVDLGLPRRLLEHLPADQPLGLGGPPTDPADDAHGDDWEAPRPAPDPAAGKYDRGRLLVIAGSARYRGAGHLALAGASASGCGSLRAALPPDMGEALWMVHPHVVLEEPPLGSSSFERLDAVLVGPGLGAKPEAKQPGSDEPLAEPWWDPLQRFPGLLVLDADGLNRVTPAWLSQRQGPTWITPHGGEFGQLFPDLAGSPPLEAAAEAARRTGVTVLLKGARSVIAAADGRRWQLLRACGAAARAGLGDVLAGYAAGLGSQAAACGCLDASLLAVAALDHALAGCRCTELRGPGGATPQAIASTLAWAAPGERSEPKGGKTVIRPTNPG
jgi:NAD(P)H-hydrate epimerase